MFFLKNIYHRSSTKPSEPSNELFSPAQMEQIRLGQEAGLSERLISYYAKPDIDCFKMWDLREKLYYILDVPFLVERYRPDDISGVRPPYTGWIATIGGIYGDIAGSRYEFYGGNRAKLTFETAVFQLKMFSFGINYQGYLLGGARA